MNDKNLNIETLQEEMIETLSKWIQIPSVKGESKPGAPFGEEVRTALDTALSDAEKMGFSVRNFDGYAGDVRMGPEGVNPLAILAHLDVVPTGDGWECDPFGALIKDGKVYGRGTSDDKGPAVAALFAMYAIQKAGIPLKREVRLILGCDEESGWGCMEYYKKHCDMPKVGFSPDANFPVINTEKGLLHLSLFGDFCSSGLKVKEINVGERCNVIPGIANAVVYGTQELCEKVQALAANLDVKVLSSANSDGTVTISVTGIPGHAANPEIAKNALGYLVMLLGKLGAEGALGALAERVGTEYDGHSLGICCQDETSGALTCNLGILKYNEQNGLYATLDIRYPLLVNANALYKTISAAFGKEIRVEIDSQKDPHHVSVHSPLIQCLLDAYNEVTGLPRECIAIGGGTYSRVLEEGVAFGSIFPGEEELAHQANEYISIDSLMKNIAIFAHSILKLQDF